jgi:hypothetical protein
MASQPAQLVQPDEQMILSQFAWVTFFEKNTQSILPQRNPQPL